MNKNYPIPAGATCSGGARGSRKSDRNGDPAFSRGGEAPPRQPAGRRRYQLLLVVGALFVASLTAFAASSAQEVLLQLDPAGSGTDITLTGNLHSVEGSFAFKRGSIRYIPATGAVSGEVVFDATSGKTGNAARDKKMHKDVLASQLYPEIVFHPDHAEGSLAPFGQSTLQVHGLFQIHGSEHEITIPVQMNVQDSTWSAQASFTIPYTKWGMKNPSVLFFRVGDEVKVDFHGAGSLTR